MSNWYDKYGGLNIAPDTPTDHGVLFRASEVMLDYLRGKLSKGDIAQFDRLAKAHEISDGIYAQSPLQVKEKRYAGHDNTSAIVNTSYLLGLNHHKNMKIWFRLWHPRDYIWFSYIRNKWYDKWCYLFLPLLFCMFLVTALTKYKRRPKIWDWIREGFPERRKILKTDTEILYWQRYVATNKTRLCMRLIGKVINPLLRKRFGDNVIYAMHEMYYKYPTHPNREKAKKLPENKWV